MIIEIDPSSPKPPFEQLRSAVIAAVREGTLAPGAKLPPVRRLAEDLGLAANTVARAYRELEADGVVVTRGRNGTVIAETGDAAHQTLQRAATDYAATAARLGVDADEALAIVEAAMRAH
ncbi:GntR family transcriptional regulator [Agromyces atrinae]|uniref:DNA-binding transcriptional regulator YhcF (GntR family) n=1 Tax=Agromyces atrinae TaxID=592376 RepID=A0A852SHG0_9MICO|nr:GntR family transcriptional regulator [Agromyces atrinae]NYD67615.1 DNA-binding transcriptional regulator YhcF (GntR family) [Agromyces atrinae]